MDVTVQVTSDLVPALRREAPATEQALAIEQTVQTAGGSLRPLHPGAAEASLARYFAVDMPDAATAQHLAGELLKLHGVEAAYVKPPDALP